MIDTGWHAPRLDAWLAQVGQLPGTMTFGMDPGALLATLSDPTSSVGYHGGAARDTGAAALGAATVLLFAPQRRPDDLEFVIGGWSREVTTACLDQAQDALRRSLEAVDLARDLLGE